MGVTESLVTRPSIQAIDHCYLSDVGGVVHHRLKMLEEQAERLMTESERCVVRRAAASVEAGARGTEWGPGAVGTLSLGL